MDSLGGTTREASPIADALRKCVQLAAVRTSGCDATSLHVRVRLAQVLGARVGPTAPRCGDVG